MTGIKREPTKTQKKQKAHDIFSVTAISVIVFTVSVIALLLLCIFDYTGTNIFIIDYLKPFLINLCNALITLSLGTLALDFFGHISYTRKRIAEIFTKKELVDILDEDYKKQLKAHLLQSIYVPSTHDSEALIQLFDSKIGELLTTYYYSSYELRLCCSIVEKNGSKFFEKKISRTVKYKEINVQKKNTISNFLSIGFGKDTASEISIQSIVVDGIALKYGEDFEEQQLDEENAVFHEFVSKQELEIQDEMTVTIQYTTIVPITDRQYVIKLDHLCKNTRCTVTFDKETIDVNANGFLFTTQPSDFSRNSLPGYYELHSDSWLLPGEGIVLTITEKF